MRTACCSSFVRTSWRRRGRAGWQVSNRGNCTTTRCVYEPQTREIGDYRFTIAFADIQRPVTSPDIATAGGMIIQIGPEEYLIAGQGITVTFKPVGDGPASAGIDSAYEGVFDAGGGWVPGRLLNGDQTHQGRHIRLGAGRFADPAGEALPLPLTSMCLDA